MKNIIKCLLIATCVFAFCTPVFAVNDYYNLTARKNIDKTYVKNAINKYTETIASNPNSEDAYINRAFLNYLLDNLQEAIGDYDKLISLNPNNEEFYLNRGYLKHISHKREEALKAAEKEQRKEELVDAFHAWMDAKEHFYELKDKFVADYGNIKINIWPK